MPVFRRPVRVSSANPRDSLYQEVTDRIIAELEAGRIPWVQPWGSAAATTGLPRNALSGRAYSGINILLLWSAVVERGYPAQGWLTFKQAIEAGGAVRKGEKGVTIVYADRFTPHTDSGDDAASHPGSEDQANRPRWFLKRFTVFNVAQCDNLPERLTVAAPPLPECEAVPIADALIAATGADVRIGGALAYYAPGEDYVQLPPQPAFRDPINFYRTALHELTHWVGGASRLARDQSGLFGSDCYAREELCAELGSAFLCAALGIVPTVRHADYIACWLDLCRARHNSSNHEQMIM
jgi:antirestriction protein ArdC